MSDDVASGGFTTTGSGTGSFAGSGLGKTTDEDGYAPLDSIPNHVTFAPYSRRLDLRSRAGDCMIADISTWHTAMPNTSELDRSCTIISYTSSRVRQGPWAGRPQEVLQDWVATGLLSGDTARLLGLA